MEDAIKQAVHEKQVDGTYQSLPFCPLVTAIVVALLLLFLRESLTLTSLTTWTLFMGAVIFFRSVVSGFYFYNKKQGTVNAGLFEFLQVVGVLMAAACWGSVGFWLYPLVADVGSRFFIVVVLVGLAAGSIGLLSYRFYIYFLFATIVLFSLVVGVNMADGSQQASISLAISICFFFLLFSARRVSENSRKMFVLQEEAIASEQLLKKAWSEVAQSKQSKSDFLANVSYEIRTPMNSISGLNHLLALETDLSPKQLYYLQSIQNSADSLLALLNNVLDLAKVEAGQLELEAAPFVLRKTVEEALQSVEVAAKEKGLELNCHVESEVAQVVIGDSYRLKQILVNLLSNAVKYTDEGAISLRVIANDHMDDFLTFIVEDSGVGIAPDMVSHIFDSLTSIDSASARRYGGRGMGLAISKKLCSLMGGDIEVKSVQDKGTVFQVHLALPPEWKTETASLVKVNDERSAQVTGLDVLLVEDNKTNRDVVRLFLNHDKHRVTEAVNGFQALQMLADKDFDAIFMDIQMPVMDGYEATRIIRACEQGEVGLRTDIPAGLGARLRGRHVPIVALTAHVQIEDVKQCLALGMDSCLTKPLQPEELTRTLVDVVGVVHKK